MRLGLFGGSFDPPHIGHQMAMLYALATARLDELLVVPAFRHPFDKRLSPYEHRLRMAELATAPFGSRVVVSDIERRLGGESRTLHTVRALREERPAATIVLVIGADLLAERERWFGYPELARLVEFAVVGRKGYGDAAEAPPGPPIAVPDVSSHEIRDRVARGEPVASWVSTEVVAYIEQHGLYR